MDDWTKAISDGLTAARVITRKTIKEGERLPGQYNGSWVVLPAPVDHEAWCESPGVLSIEVPDELAYELLTWVESQGVRCAQERGGEFVTLHCNTRLAPAPATEGGE